MEAESVKKLENNKSQKGKKDWEWKRQRWKKDRKLTKDKKWKKDRKLTKDKKWKKSKEGQKIRGRKTVNER